MALFVAGAVADDELKPAHCGKIGHYRGDGLNHDKSEPCWADGHTYCDGRDHSKAECRIHLHYVCDGRDHSPAICGAEGHYVCDYKGKHAPAGCGIAGHCVSDELYHVPAYCGVPGHYSCDGQYHYPADCGVPGHGMCSGGDHTRAVCGAWGHYNCIDGEHAIAACGRKGHCISDGKAHEAAPCGIAGHALCDGRDHEPGDCGVYGHFACVGGRHYAKVISKYCDAYPQHMVCEGNPEHYCDPSYGGCGDVYVCSRSNAHTPCRMCGLIWCDRSLGGHETPCENANHRPCVYTMNGKKYVKYDHDFCGYCFMPRCTAEEHGNTKCVDPCPLCGYPLKADGSHIHECGQHYACQAGAHGPCACGATYACNKKHTCPEKQ